MTVKSLNISSRALTLALTCFAVSSIASAGQIVPDFSSFASNGTAVTPLSYTDSASGVMLTFSSPDGTFSVTPTFFHLINGNALYDTGKHFYTLQVDFSSPITDFATSFALDTMSASANGTLTAAVYLGGNLVDTVTATSAIPSGYHFPEGTLSILEAGGFDKIVLTSNIGDYALGRDEAGTGGGPGGTATPEPVSLLLSGAGLAALVVYRKRRTAH